MMSPQMAQQILIESKLSENELSKQLFVPCLQKMSMLKGYAFRDIKFVGGTTELGNDIEFYESIGPDRHRLYTGIQVKKGDINQSLVTDLIRQGDQALEKDIFDPSMGHNHTFKVGRWIIATTGNITTSARALIAKKLSKHGTLIAFWDGIKLSEFLLDNYYDEFIKELNVNPILAGSQNVRIHLWDPENPQILIENFSSDEWTNIDLSKIVPPLSADTVYLAFYASGGNFPNMSVGVKTTIDDLVIDCVSSQVSLIPIRIAEGEISCKIKMVGDQARPIKIIGRGFRFII